MPARRAAAGVASSASHGHNRSGHGHGHDEHGHGSHGHGSDDSKHHGHHDHHHGSHHKEGHHGHRRKSPRSTPSEATSEDDHSDVHGAGVQLDSDEHQPPPPPAPRPKLKDKISPHAFLDKLRKAERQTNPLYGEHKIAARIVTHPFFEPICLGIICINALWIGYSVDSQDPDGGEKPYMNRMTDNFFCLFFSGEIIIRIAAYRHPLSFCFDPVNRAWNLFDFTLVVFLLGETWMLPMATSSGKSPDLPALSAMRLGRLLRMVRVLRMVPELAMMVRSLVKAIRGVSTTCVLAVGIMYIFAIILTQWAKGHKQKKECSPPETCVDQAFGSIAKSFLTLMQILCFDASFELIRAILDEHIFYGLFLILFILIAAFTVLNMLIGVVCQIVASTSASERSAARRQQVETLFRLLEIEGTGFISRKELQRNEHVLSELDKAGVDQEILTTAQNILNRKGSQAHDDPTHLDLEELLEVVFKLLHAPQTQDILLVQSKLEKLEKALSTSGMNQADEAQAKLDKHTNMLAELDEHHPKMDEATRMAVEQSLWDLETQVSSMLDHAMETTGKTRKPPAATGWDVELRRLDAAMCRLRVRLERCQDEAGPVSTGKGGVAADEAVNLASVEMQYWRKLCGEVVQSISAASTLMAQAVRDAEPDGTFTGSPEALFKLSPPEEGGRMRGEI